MHGASRASFAAVSERLESLLDVVTASADRIRLAEDLFAVVGLLDGTPALRRALTDPSRAGSDKGALSARLLADRVSRDTVDLVGGVVRERWAQARDIADAIETLAVSTLLASAEAGDRLGTVEEEIFRFERLIAADSGVRRAIMEQRAPVAVRSAFVGRLVEGRTAPETAVMVRQIATHLRGRTPEAAFADVLEAAALRRERLVAQVTSAVLLTQAQRQRLIDTLARTYGSAIRLALDVDPEVVGGLRIQIRDDVYDGTVSRRISEATEHMTR